MKKYLRGRVWYIGYSHNGKRRRIAVGTSEEQADLVMAQMKMKLSRNEPLEEPAPAVMIFDKLCDEYLEFSKANKTPQSFRRDQTSIANLKETFGGKLITAITAHNLERYKSKRRNQVKPATINRELSCIKHMFNKAVHFGFLRHNQLNTVKKFKEPPGRVRYLNDEEIAKVLDQCASYLKPIVICALNTGMRKGEILSLKWQDVDLKNRFLFVRKAKNNETRTLPICEVLYETLKEIGPQLGNQYVFTHADGRPFREIYYGFKAAVKRAGINDFRFHDLRHTCASRLAMQGLDIRVIQELLGQKTLAMTMRYSHLSHKTLRNAVDQLNLGSNAKLETKTGKNGTKMTQGNLANSR